MLSLGLTQFDEMTTPRIVEGETSHKKIAQETEFAHKLAERVEEVPMQEIDALLLALETLDFQHAPPDSILLSPKLPYIALAALRQGSLNEKHGPGQVATLLIFWAATQQYEIRLLRTCCIFDLAAQQFIKKTLRNPSLPHLRPFLHGKKFATFIDIMRTLPSSEEKFLCVPAVLEEFATIPYSIKATGVNVFNLVRQKFGGFGQIIPSFGMMQAFLTAQFQESAVTIKPRTHLSTLRHIRENRLTSTCDMMLPTPDGNGGSHCPLLADRVPAPWNDFARHDFFHAVVSSNVEKPFREMGIGISDLLRECAGQVPEEDCKGVHQLAFAMIDMEYIPLYHFSREKSPRLSPMYRFWETIDLGIELLKEGEKEPISRETEIKLVAAIYNWFQASTDSATFKSIVAALQRYVEKQLYDEALRQPLLRFWQTALSSKGTVLSANT